MLGLYLADGGQRVKTMIDGACLYAPIWDFKKGDEFFYKSYGGLPDWAISMNAVRIIRSSQLDDLRKYWSEEQRAVLERGLETCTGFKTLIEYVYIPMFGYKDYHDFTEQSTLVGKLHQIQVPTVAFGAADDYLNDRTLIPHDEVKKGRSQVMIATSEYGTHCNHMTGDVFPKSWYQYPCAEFLQFMIERKKRSK